MRKRERERRKRKFALLVEQVDRSMKRMPSGRGISKPWQDELALWQGSKSQVRDDTLHPVVKGDHEYFEKLDLRAKRYSQGGTHERLRTAAIRRAVDDWPKKWKQDEWQHRAFIGRGNYAIKWGCTYAG